MEIHKLFSKVTSKKKKDHFTDEWVIILAGNVSESESVPSLIYTVFLADFHGINYFWPDSSSAFL